MPCAYNLPRFYIRQWMNVHYIVDRERLLRTIAGCGCEYCGDAYADVVRELELGIRNVDSLPEWEEIPDE